MPLVRLAIATAPFQLPVKQAIDIVGQLGVEGIQLDARSELKPSEMGETARKQLRHFLAERSLTLGSLAISLNRPLYEREKLDLRIERVREAMVLASQLKVPTLVLRAGQIPIEADSSDRGRLIDVLGDLAAFGNHLGVVPTITPSDDAVETLRDLTRAITTGPIAIDFDPAGFVMARRRPIDALRDLYDVIHHIQIRDGRRDVDGVGVETVVGQGEVPWIELLATTAEMNYRGWLTIRRTLGDDRPGDCGRAAKFLRGLALRGF